MHYSFDAVDDLLAVPFFSFTLGDKLGKVQNLAMQEQKDVFDLEGALAEPRILALVKLFCNSCLQIAVFLPILILCCSCLCICSLESIFRHLVKAQEVLIQLVCFTDSSRLAFIFPKSEFVGGRRRG